MPRVKRRADDSEKAAREVAFAALHARGESRLDVQERLGISRSEYYRLRGRVETPERGERSKAH